MEQLITLFLCNKSKWNNESLFFYVIKVNFVAKTGQCLKIRDWRCSVLDSHSLWLFKVGVVKEERIETERDK